MSSDSIQPPPTSSARSREVNSEVALAWVAGLLEGEGYFGLIRNTVGGKVYLYARVGCSMTDQDIVVRLADLIGGKVYAHKPKQPRRKPYWRVEVRGQKAVALMNQLRPHMGARRQEQIDTVLEYEAQRVPTALARQKACRAAAKDRPRSALGTFA